MPRERETYEESRMCYACNGTGICSCGGSGYYRDNFDGGKSQYDIDTVYCSCSGGRCSSCGGSGRAERE